MSSFDEQKTSGDQQSTPGQQLSGVAGVLQEKMEEHLELLRYLCTCDKLDHDKMATYISMFEQTGAQWSSEEKRQILNANAFIAPKRQSNGTVLDGYEQLRIEFIEVHAGAISESIKLLTQLSQEPSTASFLERVLDEMNELLRYVKFWGLPI